MCYRKPHVMKDLCLVSVGREFVTAVCYFYEHTRNSEHFDMMRAVFFFVFLVVSRTMASPACTEPSQLLVDRSQFSVL